MSNTTKTSNDLIDDLVRQFFAVEPDVMATLALDDEQVRLRLMPGQPETTDPLDGLEVSVRRVVAMCLAIRKNPGAAVSLVTERQAQRAGWSTAQLANMAVTLAWGLYIELETCAAMPVLLVADETVQGVNPLIRVTRDLPPLPKLLTALRRGWYDAGVRERVDQACQEAPALQGRSLAPLHDNLRAWLGVDADNVELPADRHGRRVTNSNARAAAYISCLIVETLDLARVMEDEMVMAVRVKTEDDARMARLPGAVACNFVLLAAAAIHHGGGITVHFLPPSGEYANALVTADQRIRDKHDRTPNGEAVDSLELEDLARRGFVHVGRRAARRVAQRLCDQCTRSDVRMVTAGGDAAS